MPYKIFCRAIPTDDGTEEELNRFLAGHRVAGVQTQWVSREGVPYLVFAVEYTQQREGFRPPPDTGPQAERIDYQKVLGPEEFKRFHALREARRKLAEAEGVKPFVVFTNAQLAAMVTSGADSLAALGRIEGVGEARVQKYGAQVLAALKGCAGTPDAEGGTLNARRLTLNAQGAGEAAP
jgi:superfamily II DNA helicase RecQ